MRYSQYECCHHYMWSTLSKFFGCEAIVCQDKMIICSHLVIIFLSFLQLGNVELLEL